MTHDNHSALVLAIHPITNGFGYVLMTSPLSPVDFGVKSIRRNEKNAESLKAVAALVETHNPEVLVLEDPTAPGSQRKPRIRRLVDAIVAYAQNEVLDLRVLSRDQVRECFKSVSARTRQEIAVSIAHRVPALKRFLPPPRKRWNSESSNMSIFAAAALALTYFYSWSR
jgi:hypothetical protein